MRAPTSVSHPASCPEWTPASALNLSCLPSLLPKSPVVLHLCRGAGVGGREGDSPGRRIVRGEDSGNSNILKLYTRASAERKGIWAASASK